jgi:hypothetical protein
MLKTIRGIYNEGKIEFLDTLPNMPKKAQVIVTFLNLEDFTFSDSPPYHDLDHLFGHWSERDEDEFLSNTIQFSKIDLEL